jgi:hypothetical protein
MRGRRGGKTVVAMLAGAVVLSQSGCASYMVARSSQQQVSSRRAIEASQHDGGIAIGVNLLSLETLKERPILQIGAAILDAAAIYGTYELADRYIFDNRRTSSTHYTDDNSIPITVRGDGNTIILQWGPANAQRDTSGQGGGE